MKRILVPHALLFGLRVCVARWEAELCTDAFHFATTDPNVVPSWPKKSTRAQYKSPNQQNSRGSFERQSASPEKSVADVAKVQFQSNSPQAKKKVEKKISLGLIVSCECTQREGTAEIDVEV